MSTTNQWEESLDISLWLTWRYRLPVLLLELHGVVKLSQGDGVVGGDLKEGELELGEHFLILARLNGEWGNIDKKNYGSFCENSCRSPLYFGGATKSQQWGMKVCTEKICYAINKINENKLSRIIFYENIKYFAWQHQPSIIKCGRWSYVRWHRTHQDLDKSSSWRRNQRTDNVFVQGCK